MLTPADMGQSLLAPKSLHAKSNNCEGLLESTAIGPALLGIGLQETRGRLRQFQVVLTGDITNHNMYTARSCIILYPWIGLLPTLRMEPKRIHNEHNSDG